MKITIELIIAAASVTAPLISTIALIIYSKKYADTTLTKPFMLVSLSMLLITISEIIDMLFTTSFGSLELIRNSITLFALILMGVVFTRLFLVDFVKSQQKMNKLEIRANTDVISGLANRRRFDHFLEKLIANHRYSDDPLSLVLFDLDQFKILNDTYGHPGGDQAINVFGRILEASIRDNDLAARIGGDEFGLILPNTTKEKAIEIAGRIREKLEETEFTRKGAVQKLTCSIGVAAIDGGEKMLSGEELFMNADKALYMAKRKGRNIIIMDID